MKRFDVLERQTPVFGHFFLEASAGTGKTFAIEHIVIRSLLEAKEPLTIDQILIVTFTRAATRELKMRVKSCLIKTLLHLQARHGGPGYLAGIFEAGEGAIFSAIRKVEEALYSFDRASIYTLHGFCHKSLSEGAFETGAFFDMPSSDALAHREKMKLIIEDFLRVGIKEESYSRGQLSLLLKKEKGSAEGLIKSLCDVVERNITLSADAPFSYYVEQVKKKLAAAREAVHFERGLALKDMQALLALYKKMGHEQQKSAEHLIDVIASEGDVYPLFDEMVTSKDYFLTLMNEDNLKKGKDPMRCSLAYPALWQELVKGISPLIERASDPSLLLLRMAADCMKLWKSSVYYEESISPDDLLKRMVEALNRPHFSEKISDKYQLAIIDEFQDTDPLQWEIFKTLFVAVEKKKTIYLVGDPKQSIYAFRNADVYTYMEALDTLGQNNRLFLDTNYRSSASLVRALNALFTKHISPSWMPMPSSKQALEVREVASKEPYDASQEKEDRGSLHFFIARGSLGRGRRWPTSEVEQQQLFPFLAQEIIRLRESQGYRFGQMALLVRDRHQADRLEKFLKTASIPLSMRRPLSLSTSSAYLALYDLVNAVVSADDIGALKRVLAGPFIGYRASDLFGGMELDIMQQAKEYLQRARKEIRHTGWGAFFSHFISSKWNNEGLSIEEDLLSREDTTLYFELRQMMQLIQETAGPALFSIDGFATYFASLSSLSTSDDTFKIPAETEEDEVVMMTIHASKGLEFDVVFAIGLVCRGGGIDDLVTIRRDKDQHLMRWDDNDPSCVMASLELDAEKMRHLYVALTRAKDRVYVPIAIETDQKNVPLSSASSIELFCQSFGKERFDVLQAYSELSSMTESKVVEHLNRLKFLASVTYTLLADEGALAPCNLSGNEKSNLIFTPQRLPYFPTRKILSFSSLHGDHEIGTIASISDDLPSDILPLGADTGTCIHDIMETILKEGLHHPLDEEGIYKCIEKKLQDSPLIAYLYTIKNLILESLCAPLITGSCSFSLCDVRKEHLFLEMEFSYAMEGGRMKGFIDAVCFFNGAYYILDWKTNYLGMDRQSYSKETVEAAMGQSGYFMQASIYQEALMRYLTLFDKRPFTQIFGGAIYLFMRGPFCYHFMPQPASTWQVGKEAL